MKIKVIDAICGAGKTSYAIQMINDNSYVGFGVNGDIYTSDKKFIYVTPYLKEVERIINLTKAEFAEPTTKQGSKYKHVKKLIEDGKSVVMTHQLFSMLDSKTLDHIESEGYILIMDEVANVLEQIKISPEDIKHLLKSGLIGIEKDGKVKWLNENYTANENNRFRDIRVLAGNENLFIYDNTAMFWTMNIRSFSAFQEVYILTYLFDGQIQRYYYELNNVQYEKYSVKKGTNGRYELIQYNKFVEPRNKIRELLFIYEDYSNGRARSFLNSNYDSRRNLDGRQKRFQLSSSWFEKASVTDLDQLRKNLINFFRNQCPTDNNKLFWTTKKEYAPLLKNCKCTLNRKDDRSKDNYVSLNMRATNDYADYIAMAYIYNKFMNPLEKKFFESFGVKVDEEQLAMSDLIQFLFRGCIRKGEPMSCYIPSERMRSLLKQWLTFKEGNYEYKV